MAAKFDASRAADARPGRGRQHADHGDDPDRRSLGAGAHPRTGPRRGPPGRGRRVPAHRRASPRCWPAARASPSSAASEADGLLLDDLRSDVNMEWVPERMWLSYMTLDAPADELDYDLAVATRPGRHAVAGRRGRARSGRGPGAAAGAGAAGVAVRGGRCGRRRGAGRGLVAAERVRGRSLRRDGRRPGGWRPAAVVTAVDHGPARRRTGGPRPAAATEAAPPRRRLPGWRWPVGAAVAAAGGGGGRARRVPAPAAIPRRRRWAPAT